MNEWRAGGAATAWVGHESELAELDLAELERRAKQARGGLGLPLREWTALSEAWRIVHALRAAGGNRSAAARSLGIGRRTLYAKLERLGLATRRWEAIGPGPELARTQPPLAGPLGSLAARPELE